MQTIDSLSALADKIDVFFIDVYGVLWNGKAFYPKALEICQDLIKQGKRIYILSNATTIGSHFKEKHIGNGFLQGVHYTDVITSGDVLKDKLEREDFLTQVAGSNKGKYLLIGLPNDRLLSSVLSRQTLNVDEAAVVYIGALRTADYQYYETLAPFLDLAQKALDKKLPAICSNPDYYAFHEKMKHVTSGLLGKWYEDHGGRVFWIGKPYYQIYDFALKVAGVSPSRAAMVGDTLRTDIMGGAKAEMTTVLITQTGMTADELSHGHTLSELVKAEGVVPDYLLAQLQ